MCGIINSILLGLLAGFMCASGVHAYSTRNFQHSLTQQNMQTVLNSIEERLRNLDKSYGPYGHRHADAIEENAKRLEALESRIERFESILTSQFDKIGGNMSMQYFKDDIARDQVLRKIDAVYERVHHKMFHIEMKIDTGERKIMEKLELMLQRFERFEDTLTSRKADIEFEVTGVLDAVEEMKVNVNGKMENLTKTLSQKLEVFVLQPQFEQILRAINDTNENIKRQTSKLYNDERQHLPTREQLHASIKKLESIVNSTRYEQQNAMRNLVVQVGRLEGKNNIQAGMHEGDSNGHQSQQLTNISRKIDDKFDKIMEQQSLFLDSCHRIQSDEPQLESKISETLEKIIDVFSKEPTIEIKDIQNIEQLIKSHDTTVRRSMYTTSHNMAVLLQKGTVHKDEIAQQVTMVQGSVDELRKTLEDLTPSQRIVQMIQDLKSDIDMKIDHNGSQVQVLLDDIRNVVHEFSENTTEHRSIDKNNIKIIRGELQNVSLKIDDFLASNSIEVLYLKIEELLKNYINTQSQRPAVDVDLDEAIRDVFGNNNWSNGNSIANATETDDEIVFQEVNCTSGILDIRMPIENNCTNCTNVNCTDSHDENNNSTSTNVSNEKLPNAGDAEFELDLRTGPDNKNSSITNQAETNVIRIIANQSEATSLLSAAAAAQNDSNLHDESVPIIHTNDSQLGINEAQRNRKK